MINPDKAGILNEADLIEECEQAIADNLEFTRDLGYYHYAAVSVLDVLRRRHLLTEQGIELVKASEAKRSPPQPEVL